MSILDQYRTILNKVICAFSESPERKEGRAMAQAIGRELGTAEVWGSILGLSRRDFWWTECTGTGFSPSGLVGFHMLLSFHRGPR
jgi:hypothetical protein